LLLLCLVGIGLVIEGREALLQRLARLRDKRPHSKGANV
jgi:hypothetical protein